MALLVVAEHLLEHSERLGRRAVRDLAAVVSWDPAAVRGDRAAVVGVIEVRRYAEPAATHVEATELAEEFVAAGDAFGLLVDDHVHAGGLAGRERAVDRREDVGWLGDELAVAAERFDDLVVAGVVTQ